MSSTKRRCFVAGCTEYKNGNTSFHRFPVNSEVAEEWSLLLKELNRQKNSFDVDKGSLICSWHFAPHHKIICGTKSYLKATAIPTIFGNYHEKQPFLTYKKEYTCELCGHLNCVTTSLKSNLFGGSQLSQPEQKPTASIDSAQSHVENLMPPLLKNDPLATSQLSCANLESDLQLHPDSELSTCDTKAKKRKRIHYPGDVKDDEDLGEETFQKYTCVLKKKIVDQRKQVKSLTQRNRRCEKKISTLKTLLKELMDKTMSKQRAAES